MTAVKVWLVALLVLALGIIWLVVASLNTKKATPQEKFQSALKNANAKVEVVLKKFNDYQRISKEEIFDTIVALQRLQIASLKVNNYALAEQTMGAMLTLQRHLMSESLGVPNEIQPRDPSVDPPARPAPVDPPIPNQNQDPGESPST